MCYFFLCGDYYFLMEESDKFFFLMMMEAILFFVKSKEGSSFLFGVEWNLLFDGTFDILFLFPFSPSLVCGAKDGAFVRVVGKNKQFFLENKERLKNLPFFLFTFHSFLNSLFSFFFFILEKIHPKHIYFITIKSDECFCHCFHVVLLATQPRNQYQSIITHQRN